MPVAVIDKAGYQLPARHNADGRAVTEAGIHAELQPDPLGHLAVIANEKLYRFLPPSSLKSIRIHDRGFFDSTLIRGDTVYPNPFDACHLL